MRMREMLINAKNKLMDNSGLEGIEYTVVLVVVLGVIVTAIVLFAGKMNTSLQSAGDSLDLQIDCALQGKTYDAATKACV